MSDMNTPEVPADVVPAAEPVAPADVPQVEAPAAAPAATPVLSQLPSSESDTQQPEAALVADVEPLSLEDAVRGLLIYVKAHRTVGDADLDAALADVEAALPA